MGPLVLERAETRRPAPAWAIAIVLGWLALVGVFELNKPAPDATLCLFRNVTGLPCPTCGTTRVVRAAAAGDLAGDFLLNPFMSLALAGFAVWLALRVGFRRQVRLRVPPLARGVLWTGIAAGFLLSWVRVMAYH